MKFGTVKIIAVTLVAAIALAAVVALVVINSGAYNVAATVSHHAMTERMLSSMMDNSVRHHSSGIEVSPSFSTPDLDEGFEHYQAMCVTCHGAPGVEKSEAGQGLNPPAPNLAKTAADLSPQGVFWILKNGIKMTGMPAFGPTHDDEKLWDITAFVKRLPSMTAEQYRAMEAEAESDEPMTHDH